MNINFVVYVEKDVLNSIDNEYIAHVFQNIGKILGTSTTRKMSFTDTSLLTLCKKCQYLCTYAPFSAFDK